MKFNSLTEFSQPKEKNFIILATDQFFKKTTQRRLKKTAYLIVPM